MQIKALPRAMVFSSSRLLNYPEFLDSCLSIQFTGLINIDQMLIDRSNIYLRQHAISFCVNQTVSSSTRTSILFSPACLEKIRNSAVLFLMRGGGSLVMVFFSQFCC